MRCVVCGGAPELGVLCRDCARKVPPADGLIPDHIKSTVEPSDADAWLVDGFGGAHAIGAHARIGRTAAQLVVLAPSVSREHAEVVRAATGWMVRDLGSRNGTFVDGAPVAGEAALPTGKVLKVGDVALFFLAELPHEPPPRASIETAAPRGALLHYRFSYGNTELCIVAGDENTAGGALLWRTGDHQAWTERGLAPLEFQLLRLLCARAHAEVLSPLGIRGCVPSKQLARELPFQSKYANHENVRQVVLRVRGILDELGAKAVLAVAPRRGYYLDARVIANMGTLDVR